jgi:low affinity Fe/Cu permease
MVILQSPLFFVGYPMKIVVFWLTIFCWDIPLHRPYIGLIYDRYLQ